MKNDILALTEDLIRIPSTIDAPIEINEILDRTKKELAEYPFRIFSQEQSPSLLFHNQKTEQKKFKIILTAHINVFPADKKQFEPYIKDGKIYGRGSFDMKSSAAAMILLFKELGQKVSFPLGLQLVSDSESEGKHTTSLMLKAGVTSDFVIIGEGTDLTIMHEAKGRYALRLTTIKETAQEAILRINGILKILTDHYPPAQKETEKTTLSVTKIENTAQNNCVAYIDIRYAAEEKEVILNKIRSLIPPDTTIEIVAQFAPVKTDSQNHFIKKLQIAGGNILGHELLFKKDPVVSEANLFAQAGIDVVEFGPVGYSRSLIDIKEEWVDIKSLEQYYEILKDFLLSIK